MLGCWDAMTVRGGGAESNRLVRLGILLEPTTPLDAVCRLATLADRAGLDGLWLRGQPTALGQEMPAPSAVLETLAAAAERTSAITLGAYLIDVPGPAEVPAGLVGRLEVSTGRYGIHRLARSDVRVVLVLTALSLGRLPPGVDTVVVPATSLAALARPPFAVAVELAASVGRTTAEAVARAERDPRLRGARDPRRGGLFGTLEECQARVGELADAGVTEVRCWIPDTPDVADVIAQLSGVPVGTLTPTQEGHRARPPAAPPDWGGRPRHAE
jgi:alkanesulfonate monooxygenase SsuD/methylene tetrahydromethanopterin reductase-like flavin-dependent oxidoreductase (luciferase family)